MAKNANQAQVDENQARQKTIYKVTIVGFLANTILTALKFFAGFVGHSAAMIADAVHSLSDFATDIVVLFFVKVAGKPRDEGHSYGHGKYETLATVIIGGVLFAVGVGILVNGIEMIVAISKGKIIERPGAIALVAAAFSIIVKEALYWYTVKAGKKVNAPMVVANAWHHRSDAFSSIGTLIGIGGAFFLGENWRVLDPIAAVLVSVFIMKVSIELVVPSLNELVEKSLPTKVQEQIMTIIMQNPLVCDPHGLKTRQIGQNIAVDVHIRVDGSMTVDQSHEITVDIEHRLRDRFGCATMVNIHVEPTK